MQASAFLTLAMHPGDAPWRCRTGTPNREASARETLANFERLGILNDEVGDRFTRAAEQAGVDR